MRGTSPGAPGALQVRTMLVVPHNSNRRFTRGFGVASLAYVAVSLAIVGTAYMVLGDGVERVGAEGVLPHPIRGGRQV